VKFRVFWDVLPCSQVNVDQRFRGAYCLHHHGLIDLMMEAVRTFGCFGDVVVSVLATGTKGRGFKPGQGDGFLRAIKIRSTPSFGWEVKREGPMS
jgi:hypothetical protein